MKKGKMFKTFLGGALAVSMIVPLSISALANDTDSTSIKDSQLNSVTERNWKDGNFHKGKGFKRNPEETKAEFESLLEDLVNDGILTSTQVDKIKEMAEENKGKRVNFFSELIDEGTLTEEEVDAIHEKLHEKKESEKQERMQSMLDDLVEKGIITEDNASEILDFVSEKAEERKAKFEEIQDMTEEERKSYFEENKPEKGGLTEDLVDEGIISQDQADEIAKLLPRHGKGHHGRKGFEGDNVQRQEKMTEILDQIVEDGTLSQEKADKILDFINEKDEDRKAEFEKMKDMTEEERKEYFEENRPEKTSLLDELVEEGIITQDEADELLSIFPQGRGPKGFKENK